MVLHVLFKHIYIQLTTLCFFKIKCQLATPIHYRYLPSSRKVETAVSVYIQFQTSKSQVQEMPIDSVCLSNNYTCNKKFS